MKITILYDNETNHPELIPEWGFSCLIEAHEKKILFDTGGNGEILIKNIQNLGIDISTIDGVFISHDHWDHNGGISAIAALHNSPIYIPSSFDRSNIKAKTIVIKEPQKIFEGFFSTGELLNIEQSLIVESPNGLVIITGCSHSEVSNILKAASKFGKPFALIGGLHGFDKYNDLKELTTICPTHCTEHIKEINEKYPEKTILGGVGKIIEI